MQCKSIFEPSPLAPGVIFKIVTDMNPFIAGCQGGPGVQGKEPWVAQGSAIYHLKGKHYFEGGGIHVFFLYCQKHMILKVPS